MLIDSHCHLDFPAFAGEEDALLAAMRDNAVTHALCVSVCLPDWPRLIALVERHAALYASVGVHPDYDDEKNGDEEPDEAPLIALAAHPKVVAIGETGLDYYRLDPQILNAEEIAQKKALRQQRFRVHIRAARALSKPLIVHTRAAADDTIRLLREEGADTVGGVMHCFTETQAVAEAAMELGFYISFSGIVTFKNARDLQEIARALPLDRMLVETDAPYLAPIPYRGQRNQPAYVRQVAAFIAELRGVSLEEIATATTANFRRLFRLPLAV